MTAVRRFELGIFGPFEAQWSDGTPVTIKSAKGRAFLAMLATSPNGVRSRKWLQHHLWFLSGEEHGLGSLRALLTDMRKVFGPFFDQIFICNNFDITLVKTAITLTRQPKNGVLLEGINVKEPFFEEWRAQNCPTTVTAKMPRIPGLKAQNFRPVIAVMPFQSVSQRLPETHIGDLLAREATRLLSKSRMADVISHVSSRSLISDDPSPANIREKLEADYVISGNIYMENETLRLDADLIDLHSGYLVWSGQFFGAVQDILRAQSSILTELCEACGREILRSSIDLAMSRPLPQVASHALFMSAVASIHKQYRPSFDLARSQLVELIARMPKEAYLHAWMAKWYIMATSQGWSDDPSADLATATECSKRALDLDPDCPLSLTIDGMILGDRAANMSQSAQRFGRAIEQDPNHALAWLMSARMHSYMSNGAEAVEAAQQAKRLSPLDPHMYFFDIISALGYLMDEKPEQAITLAQKSIKSNGRHASSFRLLAIAQQQAGAHTEAATTVQRLLRLEPNLTVSSYLATHPAGRLPAGRQMADLLKQAGVPQ